MSENPAVSQAVAEEKPPETASITTSAETKPTQYKATRIWYEIINSFHESITLKKHWRNFRTYPDCFSASEAVEWLFRYLKASPNFKSHTSITRQQAIQLLQIFLKEKIIEDVRSSDVKFTFKEFQDDDRLYKFGTNKRFFKTVIKQTPQTEVKETITISEKKTTETIQCDTKNSTFCSTEEKLVTIKENLRSIKPVSVVNKENVEPLSPLINKKTVQTTATIDLMSIKSDEQTTTSISSSSAATTSITSATPQFQTSSYNKMFHSKLENGKFSSNGGMIQRAESLKRRPVNARSHHYNHGKLIPMKLTQNEEEVWSRVAQKLFESIIKKALNANENCEFTQKTSSSSLLMDSRLLAKYDSKLHNVNSLLFEEGFSASKVVSGTNIHHNCTHVNKHGVVIDTDDDYPAWLIKAMTCLMNWKEEPDEYPPFKDVFAEVNNHFSDLSQPLITPQVACLLRNTMALLLLPASLLPSQKNAADNSAASSCYYTAHTTNTSDYFNASAHHNQDSANKKNFDSLIHNLKTQMSKTAAFYDEEEMKLVENAKLAIVESAIIEPDLIDTDAAYEHSQLIQDIFIASVVELEECCEDCLHKYNAIHRFINRNAIEFNEFVSSLNHLDDAYVRTVSESACNPPSSESSNATADAALRMKESRERFASLKLKFSPIKKTEHAGDLQDSKNVKRLHRRNNSFRTAIGEIEKNESFATAVEQPSKMQKTCNTTGRKEEDLSTVNDTSAFKLPFNPDSSDSSSICKSFSLNSIASNSSQVNERKRKLLQNSSYCLTDNANDNQGQTSNEQKFIIAKVIVTIIVIVNLVLY